MSKEQTKKEVLDLLHKGHSYGKISRQTGIPKSTVSRWIKDTKDKSGTVEIPSNTGIGTDDGICETVFETSLPDETATGTVKMQNRHESELKNSEMAKVELRKAELHHEYRMAELDFKQLLHDDAQTEQQKDNLMSQLHLELESSTTEVVDLKSQNQELLQRIAEAKPQKVNKLSEKRMPKYIYVEIKKIIKKYYSFDEKLCTEEKINQLSRSAQKIRLEIYNWAKENSLHLHNIKDLSYLNILIADIVETYQSIDEGCNEGFHLEYDQLLKSKIQSWINKKMSD